MTDTKDKDKDKEATAGAKDPAAASARLDKHPSRDVEAFIASVTDKKLTTVQKAMESKQAALEAKMDKGIGEIMTVLQKVLAERPPPDPRPEKSASALSPASTEQSTTRVLDDIRAGLALEAGLPTAAGQRDSKSGVAPSRKGSTSFGPCSARDRRIWPPNPKHHAPTTSPASTRTLLEISSWPLPPR